MNLFDVVVLLLLGFAGGYIAGSRANITEMTQELAQGIATLRAKKMPVGKLRRPTLQQVNERHLTERERGNREAMRETFDTLLNQED